jgi:3-hydroxymyristoyl/3-hydroxydecanoyl-(acyl carrier protein) dehydratase
MVDPEGWQVVPPDHPSLAGHFPGHPVVPGVVLLSYVWDAIQRRYGLPLACAGWPSVKFLAPLAPDEPFMVEVEFGTGTSAKFTCKTAQRTIAQGNARLVAKETT